MLEDTNKDGSVTEAMRNKKKTIKRLIIALLIVLGVISGSLAAGGYYLLSLIQQVPLTETTDPGHDFNAESGLADSQDNPPSSAPQPSHLPQIPSREDLMIPDDALAPDETGIINILLLGLDRRADNEGARSDAILIASVDKKKNQVKLTSLMRDMYVPIPGRQDNRINTGYIFGGPALAIKMVNMNFDMNIEHFIAVDFKGFKKIIDFLGGVEIDVTQGEAEIIGLEAAGTYNLKGEDALNYARIRRIGADYQRTDRQRLVLSTLFKKAKSVSIWRMPELLASILPNIETNLTKGEMLSLGKNILESSANPIEDKRLPVEGAYRSTTIRNMAVLVPDLEKNKQVLHEFIYGDQSKYSDNTEAKGK